ncbi:MAG: patatin-like phospholipase family protein [Hydrogenophaga sp.]|uniref:patatin-like phospholipase family protein n=1 Tax=Hydrogenophaga sp. TaxID=1904254 RepID=UPI00274D76CF|nr:patatin-like phospholipase family protein [Hydrogenophaga sp.]MDZ4189961.1 patatin-like phospholipase family protein [Hydrogenophaga sp.]
MVLNKYCIGAFTALTLAVLAGCSSVPTSTQGPVAVPVVPPVVAEPARRPPRLGLALGGGAARGFAHVGVIQVLEQHGIRPHVVVGTSAGSLVATLYASGKNAAELERVALTMEEATLTDWSLPIMGRGMLRGEALARYVRQAVDGRLIENMSLPLGILATDLSTGQGVLFRRGDAAQAVRASSAVPGVFTPVNISGRDYVDGGLVAPVPVSHARAMGAEVVLAVDISSDPQGNDANGLLKLLLQTTAIMGQTINRHELASAEVVLRPALSGVGSADFTSRQRSIEAGRAAMQAAMPRLRAELAKLRPL